MTPDAWSPKTDDVAGESEAGRVMDRSTQEVWSVSRSVTSSDMIREQTFGTSRRGFDPGQVSTYLNRVADQVATLEARVAELESDLVAGRAENGSPDPYETISSQLVAMMKAFDEDVERLRREAAAEADLMVADAKAETQRIRSDAEMKADEVLATASASLEGIKRDAEAELAQLTAERSSITRELLAIRERLLLAIDQLPEAETPETSAPATALDVVKIIDEPVGDRGPDVPPRRVSTIDRSSIGDR